MAFRIHMWLCEAAVLETSKEEWVEPNGRCLRGRINLPGTVWLFFSWNGSSVIRFWPLWSLSCPCG